MNIHPTDVGRFGVIDPPPRRVWLLGMVGAVVAGGFGCTASPPTTARQAPVVAAAVVPLQLLDFGMDICRQCKRTRALLTRIEPEYAGRLRVRYIDVREDTNAALIDQYRMHVIPLVVLLDGDGAEVWRHEGVPPEAVLREQISRALTTSHSSVPR